MSKLKTKHTPGPWIAAIDPGITTTNGKCKVFGAKSPFFVVIDGLTDYREELATARLISAAPEMLEALEALLEVLGVLRQSGVNVLAVPQAVEARALAHKAIAKARGES